MHIVSGGFSRYSMSQDIYRLILTIFNENKEIFVHNFRMKANFKLTNLDQHLDCYQDSLLFYREGYMNKDCACELVQPNIFQIFFIVQLSIT